MPDQRHIVHRQLFDLTVPSERTGREVQDVIGDAYYRRILPMMEEVFSGIVSEGEVLRLERLEIDLGAIAGPDLEESFADAIRRQLEDALLRLRHEANGLATDEWTKVVRTTRGDAKLETLLVFLQTGSLPWWAARSDAFDPEAALSDVMETAPDALANALRAIDPVVASRRLVRQFTPEIWRQLLRILTPAAGKHLLAVLKSWELVQAGERMAGLSASASTACLWEATLAHVLTSGFTDVVVSALFEQMLTRLAEAARRPAASLLAVLETAAQEVLAEDDIVSEWLRKEVAHRATEAASGARTRGQTGADARDGTPGKAASEQPAPIETVDRVAQQEPELPDARPIGHEKELRPALEPPEASAPIPISPPVGIEESHPFTIENAGLILLWPFLGPFLESVHLLDDSQFVSEAAQRRAVLLTQYFVTGEPDSPEHQLLLNKLLCGWPPEEPVERAITLTAEEEVQVLDLLTSAVTHWSALKNTSVEGLRRTFLQRAGELVRQESQWLLKVERKAYDVLLGRLPWSLGIVKQRWMEAPIFVEW